MAQQSEFIAILSSGTSFNRILRPYIVAAFLLASFSLVFNHFILPKAFKIKIGFEDKWINKNYNNDEQNIHKKIGPNRLLYIESYDNSINTAYKVTLEDVFEYRQTYFLSAETMKWDSLNQEWIMYKVRERTIDNRIQRDNLHSEIPQYEVREKYFPEKRMKMEFYPMDMWRDESKIETKTYFELKEYIAREKQKGSNRIELYEVENYKRTSFPFATFILTIIGVCVSSRKVRGGVGFQIALGLLLSCIYIMLMYVFTTIATTGFASPLLGVWTPNIIFSLVALHFYRTAQK